MVFSHARLFRNRRSRPASTRRTTSIAEVQDLEARTLLTAAAADGSDDSSPLDPYVTPPDVVSSAGLPSGVSGSGPANGPLDAGNLSVSLSANVDVVEVGDSVTLTATVTNRGPLPILGASLNDVINFPTGSFTLGNESLIFADLGSGTLVVDLDGPNLTDLILPAGEVATMTFDLTAVAGEGPMDCTINVLGGLPVDLFPSDNTASITISVIDPVESVVVTTLTDEDDGNSDSRFGDGTSLREALAFANADPDVDTITFDASLAGGTIALTLGQLTIDEDVSITGAGSSALTVDAGGLSRVFFVDGADASIFGLTISGGDAGVGEMGGGLLAVGGANVALTSSAVLNNSAVDGGGVYVDGGTLALNGTVFGGNAASGNGGAVAVAGGAELTLAGGRGVRNSAADGGFLYVAGSGSVASLDDTYLALNVAAGSGGALWSDAGSSLAVSGVVFSANRALADSSGSGGGAIYSRGALDVGDSLFFRNFATGAAGSGGGILSATGRAIVVGTTFNTNGAERSGGAVEIGEGVFISADSRYLRNVAGLSGEGTPGNGGAIHLAGDVTATLTGGDLVFNVAAHAGGGIWNGTDGDLRVNDLSIARNVAGGDATNGGGGGIYNGGGTLRLDGVFVSHNAATGERGSGGGVWSAGGTVLVNDSNFNRNEARRSGGGIRLMDGDLRFSDSFLRNNVADDGAGLHASGESVSVFAGGGVFRNEAADQGGGLWNGDDARLALNDVVVRGNDAKKGGGVYNAGGRVDLNRGSRLTRNDSERHGAGLYNADDGRAYLNGSRVTRNAGGGGVFTDADALTVLRDAVFAGNEPTDIGGPGRHRGDLA